MSITLFAYSARIGFIINNDNFADFCVAHRFVESDDNPESPGVFFILYQVPYAKPHTLSSQCRAYSQ